MDNQESSSSKEIRAMLQSASKPLIIAHIRPDGDAIGSVVGLGLALKEAGKSPQLVLQDGISSKFKFLDGSEMINKKFKPGYDLVIALDCSDKDRMGKIFSKIDVDINIDHHITNDHFAKLNFVLPEIPATAAILAEYLPEWGLTISDKVANALLMGMLTDTIGFRTPNVTPKFLELSAQLMEKGASLSELYEKALTSQTFSASYLWGLALSRLQKKGRIAWTSIRLEDRRLAGYPGKDDADLTNLLSAIENIDISILFNEQNNCKIKVSWRSGPNIDVSAIAHRFGGGGHPPAAGAEISGTLEEVEEMVLLKTKQYLKVRKTKGEI